MNDYKALSFIVKLQSVARGMAMRDKVKLRYRRGNIPKKSEKYKNNDNN